MNTSDCAMPPVPVFTYYKPGSRCEIELWRGCTTLNKFDSVYECSHFCIGKLIPSISGEEDNQIISSEQTKLGKTQRLREDCRFKRRLVSFSFSFVIKLCRVLITSMLNMIAHTSAFPSWVRASIRKQTIRLLRLNTSNWRLRSSI